jgi:hypothetical protein
MVRKAGAERGHGYGHRCTLMHAEDPEECSPNGDLTTRFNFSDEEKQILAASGGPHHRPNFTASFSEDRALYLFRNMVKAADRAADDPDTRSLESSVAELLQHVVETIAGKAFFASFSNREREILSGECDAGNLGELKRLLDAANKQRLVKMERALTAIESGLKQERKRKRVEQTDARRLSTILAMDAEREKGASRQEALDAINQNEDAIKQYVGLARRWLVAQGYASFKVSTEPKRRRPRRPR